MQVALLGTGLMGSRMGVRLCAVHEVSAWNRTREKAEPLAALARSRLAR
jgi:3-hydroxyisobutyrate dehydrogenase-like beta-hydroxyacid dehydrogenase